MRSLFHLAFNVTDLDEARRFYGGVLGCTEGRSAPHLGGFRFLRPPDLAAPRPALQDRADRPRRRRAGPDAALRPGAGTARLAGHGRAAARAGTRVRAGAAGALSRASPASNGPCSSATPSATRSRSKVFGRWPGFTPAEVPIPAAAVGTRPTPSRARAVWSLQQVPLLGSADNEYCRYSLSFLRAVSRLRRHPGGHRAAAGSGDRAHPAWSPRCTTLNKYLGGALALISGRPIEQIDAFLASLAPAGGGRARRGTPQRRRRR